MKKTIITKSHIIIYIMTLWDRRLGLILGLAFLTFACEEPGEIGLDINPENGTFIARYDEIPIKSTIIEYEDILSDNSTRIGFEDQSTGNGRLLTGNYSNQDFGSFHSKGFTSIYPLIPKIGSPENYVFDSLVFKVKVDYIYGEGVNYLGNKKIFVHELEEEIILDSLYLTKNTTPYLAEPVGEFNFDISSYNTDSAQVDTVFTTRLSDDLGQRFMDQIKVDTMTFKDNLEFRKFFNGIALVSGDANEVVTGIHAESSYTFIRLYYHELNDTISYTFDFIIRGLNPEGFNITKYYNNITLDKSGTPIEGIVDFHTDFETDNGLSYIHGSAGIFTKLNLGSYLNFLDTIDYLVINRAELVIPVESYNDHLAPPNPLDLYVADQDNKFIKFDVSATDFVYATANSRLVFTKDSIENKGLFVGEITDYVQGLTSGTITDSLLLVGQSSLWNSVINVNQFITAKDEITLKVYYSTILK